MKVVRLFVALILGAGLLLALTLFVAADQTTASASRSLLAPGDPALYPARNTHAAPPTATISITYDEAISPATVSTRTFAVHAMQTGQLTQTLGTDVATISLTPTQPLKPGEMVQVSATTGTLNLIGESPAAPTVWQFRAAVEAGSTATFNDSGQRLGSSMTRAVALGDLDGDGDLDAFLGNYGQANRVWLNDGGTFTDSGQALGSSATRAVALGDLDGDGDMDAFAGNYGQDSLVWLNDGGGVFTDSGQSLIWRYTRAVALGDLDGDGDLDAFTGNDGYGNEIWLNDGDGSFSDSGQSLSSSATYAVALGDLDGDGDLDAFAGNSYQANRVWLNDGGGLFTNSGQTLGSSDTRTVALGDVDGDGDLDVFVGNSGEANAVWLNDGSGAFTDSGQTLGSAYTNALALGDLDGDGDLDAFAGNIDANLVWINDMRDLVIESLGVGTTFPGLSQPFSVTVIVKNQGTDDVTAGFDTAVYSDLAPTPCDGGAGSWASQATLSLTAGSSTTLAFTHSGFGSAGHHSIYALVDTACATDNNPNNNAFGPHVVWVDPFTVTATTPPGNGLQIASDAVISATFSEGVNGSTVSTGTFTVRGQQTGIYKGTYTTGPVTFDAADAFKPGEEIVVNLSDAIQSTDGSLLIPYAWQFRAEVTNGTGVFSDSFQALNAANTYAVALGDVDTDGDLDILSVGSANTLWLNDSTGMFTDSGQSLGNMSGAAALGDLDGDGDPDAFIARGSTYSGAPNEVWLNDGAGAFADSGQSLGNAGTLAVALADLDGDGDLDAFLGNDGSNQVWSNDGSGVFTDTGQSLGDAETQAVALGDVDGDGDLDAIAGNLGQASRLWLNDGTGTFVESGQDLGGDNLRCAKLGDLDGDGDLDLTGYGASSGNQIWLNDGDGAFTDSGQRLGSVWTYGVALGDLDGDGDLDIVAAHGLETDDPNTVWLNDGTGAFTDSGQRLGGEDTAAVALGDVDGDGDLDVVFGNPDQADTVWLNNKNAPVARDDSFAVPPDSSGNILNVLANDDDPDGDSLTIVDVGTALHGSAGIGGSTVIYTPDAGFDGVDVFTYTVSDPGFLTDTATVTVTVGGGNPPVAQDDAAATDEDTAVTIDVLANDSDPDGQTPILQSVGAAANGTTIIDANRVRYTPGTDVFGSDTFTYTISDGWLTDTARVTITIAAVEDAPTLDAIPDQTIAEDSVYAITLNNVTSGAFNENQTLTVIAQTVFNPGLVPDPSVTYTSPDTTGGLTLVPAADQHGMAQIEVTVSDGVSQTVRSFWVTVESVNDPPLVDSIADQVVDEDSGAHTVFVTGIDAGPSNESGQRPSLGLSAASLDTGLIPHPAVSYNTSSYWYGSLTFTPVADRFGSTTIVVTVTDGLSATVRTFQVTVNPVNDPPTLDAISNVTIDEDASPQTVSLSGIGSGSVYENQALAVTATSGDTTLIPNPAVTYTSPDATGSLSFAPVADRFGTTAVTVTVSDGLSSTARTFQVTVNPVNDPPTLDPIPDVDIPNEAGPQLVDIGGIGAGPYETQPVTVTASSSDLTKLAHPEVIYTSPDVTGRLRLTPVPHQFGSVTVAVTVTDGLLATNRSFAVTLLEPFWVESTQPPNGGIIAQTGIVSATFNRTVNGGTVDAGSFTVRGQQTGVYQGSYTVGSVVEFDAASPFKPGEPIVVNLTDDVRSTGGEILIPYAWQFRAAVGGGTGLFVDSGQAPGYYNDIPLDMDPLAPESVLDSQAVALGDLDGDGDLDAYVVKNGAYATVWMNEAGLYVPSGQQLGQARSWALALGDLDSDGDLDAFVGNYDAGNTVWLNDGTGAFSDSGQRLGSADTYAVALGDLDGDGDLDAVVGNDIGQGSRVWLNDGTGAFGTGQSLSFRDTRAVALGDLDNDGDLDIFLGHAGGRPNEVWLNQGGAQWGARGEFVDSGQWLGSADTTAVALGDLDNDGDLDAYVGNGSGQADEVWRNDGTGTFTDSGQHLGGRATWAVALGDVDADGDLDAFVANVRYADVSARGNRVWLNDGAGAFAISGQNLGDADSLSVALGDVDGDGDLDAFVGNSNGLYQTNKLYLNQPNAPIPDADLFYVAQGSPELSLDVLVNDWDPDGDAISVTAVSAPAHGAAANAGSAVRYTPEAGFVGQDAFTYSVSDPGGLSGEVQVTVRVLALTQSVVADATLGGSLFTVDAQGAALIVDIPAGAVDTPTEFLYTSAPSPAPAPGGLAFAGKAFDLTAYRDGAPVPDIALAAPFTITIHYTDADALGLDESTLELHTWDGAKWTDGGITVVSRDPTINRVVVTVDHLTSFALFGQGERQVIYLPLVMHQPASGLPDQKPYQTLRYRAE